MKPRQRAQRTDASERLDVLVRLAQRVKGGKRNEPNTTDRKEVAKEYGISTGTLRSWVCRFPDEWKKARVLTGLDAAPAVVATVATSGSGAADRPGEGRVAPGLTVQQAEACRMRVLSLLTQRETAKRVGVHEDTVQGWGRSPAWRAYADHLATERHRAVLEAHQETAAIGGQLRVDLLAQARQWLRRVVDLEGTLDEDGRAYHTSMEELSKAAALVDRLTTSAEDRAGYPRTERREVDVSVPSPVTTLPDDELSRRRVEAESRLRLLDGGRSP